MQTRIALAALAVALTLGTADAAPPPNDTLPNATVIPDTIRSVFGTLVEATPDPFPAIIGKTDRPSVWYRIDAPKPGRYYVDTAGTSNGRVAVGELLLSVWSVNGSGPPLSLLGEGGPIVVDGVVDTNLTGVGFVVPANAKSVYIGVAVASDRSSKPFRLNLHRLQQTPPNPIVVTPPTTFVHHVGLSNWAMHFDQTPLYTIYNALPDHPAKAKLVFTGAPPGVGFYFDVPYSTVVGNNEAVTMKLKPVGAGPHYNVAGTFDYMLGVEARDPVSNVAKAKRSVLHKVTRLQSGTVTGIVELTASAGMRAGTFGKEVSFDVKVRNLTGQAANGCLLTSSVGFLTSAEGPFRGQAFSYRPIDPATGQPTNDYTPTFDMPNASTRMFRVTAEIRHPDVATLPVRLACASPVKAVSVPLPLGIHPYLHQENAVVVLQHSNDTADVDIAFDFNGSQADDAPRRYIVPKEGSKTFPIVVHNRDAAERLLGVDVTNKFLPTTPDHPMPLVTKICVAATWNKNVCAATPVSSLPVTIPGGKSRRLLVTLTWKGETIADDPMVNRLYIRVRHGNRYVGGAGFAVSTN